MAARRSMILLAALMLVAGCDGGTRSPAVGSTAPPAAPTITTTSPPAVTSSMAPTSTASLPLPSTAATFLVRSGDGVWHLDLNGNVAQLIDGSVAVAVDDTQGGLLYQFDSGRVWDETEPGSSVVWWIPRGANAPQELIVPNESAGQRVTLHDAFATDAGFAVLYTRHDPGSTPDDLVDRLRRIDIPGSEVTQLHAQTVWERGFGEIRSNGSMMAGERWGQVGSACFLLDMEGELIDRVPDAAVEAEERYVRGCRITPDNELAFYIDDEDTTSTSIQVWDLTGDEERHRIAIPNVGDWVRDIEVGPGLLVANRYLEGAYVAADVVFLDRSGDPAVQLPVPGRARVARSPIDIGGPIVVGAIAASASGPDHYRYGADGVFRVAGGIERRIVAQPVWRLWDDYMGGIIYESDRMEKLWLALGAAEPVELGDLDPADEFLAQGEQLFTGLVDGRPTIFYGGYLDADSPCDEWQLLGRDLQSGRVTGYVCLPIGDIDPGVDSVGGDWFVAAPWGYAGCTGTASDIRFYAHTGTHVDVDTNPGAQSCAPCSRGARISPDGRLLAHHVRVYAESAPNNCNRAEYDPWWAEQLERTQLVVEVTDLATGLTVWQAPSDVIGDLSDFDGRYLVMTAGEIWDHTSTIYDTSGRHDPVTVTGDVTLMRSE